MLGNGQTGTVGVMSVEDGQTEIRERRALISCWRPGVSRDRCDIGAYMEQTDVGQART